LLCRFNYTLCNHIALHYSAKNVDKYSFDLWVLGQNFESCSHLISFRATANIQKVSWLTALQLNYIHSRHSETSSIDHATDVAVECDIV
jgi:hypothetical protein